MISQHENGPKKEEDAEVFRKKAEEREKEEVATLKHTLIKKMSALWRGEERETEQEKEKEKEKEKEEKRMVWEEMLRNEAEYLCDSPGGDELLETIAYSFSLSLSLSSLSLSYLSLKSHFFSHSSFFHFPFFSFNSIHYFLKALSMISHHILRYIYTVEAKKHLNRYFGLEKIWAEISHVISCFCQYFFIFFSHFYFLHSERTFPHIGCLSLCKRSQV
jgi:hypothetical protein